MLAQRHQPDYVLYFTVLILAAIGVITVYSASTVWAMDNGLAANYLAVRQLGFAIAGTVIMTAITFWLPYRSLFRLAVPGMLVTLVLLAAVLVPGIGTERLGGRRWIGHGSIVMQPSELAMIFCLIYLAYFFTRKITYVNDFKHGVRPALFIIALECLLIILEPDMGTALTLLATSLVIVFASGAKLRKLFIPGLVAVPLIIVAATMVSYRSARISAWLHPFASTNDSSFQVLQGWTGIAAGGWFGRGFGMSIEKTGYLPIPQADFIFPVFTEEWGFVGALALLLIFALLVWRGFYIARHTPDRFSALLAVGITSMIILKTVINLGAVTGLLPVTGVPLPFISSGGTSLLVNMAAMGIVLNISRYALAAETDTDTLADVIPVDEARSLRAERSPIAPRTERAGRGGARQTAEVHHFGNSRSRGTTAAPQQTWRQRQEAAATRESAAQRRGDGRPRTAPAPSWRQRQGQSSVDTHGKSRSRKSKRGQSGYRR